VTQAPTRPQWGRAVAQASHSGGPVSIPGQVGFVVYIAALGQVFSEYFIFPRQFSFHKLLHIHYLPIIDAMQGVPGGEVIILGGHSIGHSKQKNVYTYMCPILNGFPNRAISLYSTLYTVQTSSTPCPRTSCKVH
jgi:hypothetical protein